MPKKQHEACTESEVQVITGEEFEWITTAEYCDIHILEDHPLDKDRYHVVKGTPTPAKAIGEKGRYEFECKCSGKRPLTNPHIIIGS
jgi:hypothetical protein